MQVYINLSIFYHIKASVFEISTFIICGVFSTDNINKHQSDNLKILVDISLILNLNIYDYI